MILSCYRHGVASLLPPCTHRRTISVTARLPKFQRRKLADGGSQAVPKKGLQEKSKPESDDGTITKPDKLTQSHHETEQASAPSPREVPDLHQLSHQLDLANPADIIRRRFFGPFALIRSRAINTRMEESTYVKQALAHDEDTSDRELLAPVVDTAVGRNEAARSAMHTARDLLNAQSRGVKEAGDIERIIGVAQESVGISWVLASERLTQRYLDASQQLEPTESLRFLRVYTTFLESQNGSVYPEVIWHALLAATDALNTNALRHYLVRWSEHCRRDPAAQSVARTVTLLQRLQSSLLNASHYATSESPALMAIVAGIPNDDNSVASLIRLSLTHTTSLDPLLHYIALLQQIGATSALMDTYKNRFSFTPGNKTKPVKMSSLIARFIRAFFDLAAPQTAWRIWRDSSFTAGEGSKNFERLLIKHARSRPDFLDTSTGWKLSEEEKATLKRRLEAQRAIAEDRMCKQLLREMKLIETTLMVRWVPSLEEGLAPGWHVFDNEIAEAAEIAMEEVEVAGNDPGHEISKDRLKA